MKRVIITIILVVSATGAIVTGFYLPPASPVILLSGVFIASLVGAEIIKYYVNQLMDKIPMFRKRAPKNNNVYEYDIEVVNTNDNGDITTTKSHVTFDMTEADLTLDKNGNMNITLGKKREKKPSPTLSEC